MRSSARLIANAINPTNPAPPLVQDLPVNKPTPQLGASCGHTCLDKATCKHSCCNITREREHCDGFMNDGSVNDVAVCLLDFLPLRDLIRLRQVSKVWRKMIDGSTKYRKAAFLEAELSNDPNFRASLTQAPIGPQTKDEQTSIGQPTVIPRQLAAVDVPTRSVRVNPLLFFSTRSHGTDPLVPLLPLQSYGSPFMNDKSTCMDMFLTQPPIKEVRVEIRDRAPPNDSLSGPGGSRRRQGRRRIDRETFISLTTDRDGLRFRDLYEHFSRSTDATGDLLPCPILRQNGYIPRCRVIREDAHSEV